VHVVAFPTTDTSWTIPPALGSSGGVAAKSETTGEELVGDSLACIHGPMDRWRSITAALRPAWARAPSPVDAAASAPASDVAASTARAGAASARRGRGARVAPSPVPGAGACPTRSLRSPARRCRCPTAPPGPRRASRAAAVFARERHRHRRRSAGWGKWHSASSDWARTTWWSPAPTTRHRRPGTDGPAVTKTRVATSGTVGPGACVRLSRAPPAGRSSPRPGPCRGRARSAARRGRWRGGPGGRGTTDARRST
jgi:hypothetical protein